MHPSTLSLPLCPPPSSSPPPSVAKALGVNTVGAQTLKLFYEHPIFSEVISDQEAVSALEKFVGTFCGIFLPLDFLPPQPRLSCQSLVNAKATHKNVSLVIMIAVAGIKGERTKMSWTWR
jgi:hypothetical protein